MNGLKCLNCEGVEYSIKNQPLKYGPVKFEVESTVCINCGVDYATDEQMDKALKAMREAKSKCKKYERRIDHESQIRARKKQKGRRR